MIDGITLSEGELLAMFGAWVAFWYYQIRAFLRRQNHRDSKKSRRQLQEDRDNARW